MWEVLASESEDEGEGQRGHAQGLCAQLDVWRSASPALLFFFLFNIIMMSCCWGQAFHHVLFSLFGQEKLQTAGRQRVSKE